MTTFSHLFIPFSLAYLYIYVKSICQQFSPFTQNPYSHTKKIDYKQKQKQKPVTNQKKKKSLRTKKQRQIPWSCLFLKEFHHAMESKNKIKLRWVPDDKNVRNVMNYHFTVEQEVGSSCLFRLQANKKYIQHDEIQINKKNKLKSLQTKADSLMHSSTKADSMCVVDIK